jgi:energy-coupling factor transport system permease protein
MRLFRYYPGDSYLHRLNPAIKLLAIILVTVAITFVFDIPTPLTFLAAALLLTVVVGRIPVWFVTLSMAPFALVSLSFVFINILFFDPNATRTPLFYIGPLLVSKEGVEAGVSVALRVLFLVSTSLLFVATTKPRDFVLSLMQQARLNYKLAYAVLAAFRFIPIFAEEYASIRAAAQVRGAGASSGIMGAVRSLRRDAVPLLAGAIRRSERLALAMDSRAFGAYPTRTYHRTLHVTRADWVFLGAVIAGSAALFAALAATGLLKGVGVIY